MKKVLVALAFMALFAASANAGGPRMERYQLFYGGDTDSTERWSRLIPVQGATMVVIRLWSTHLAFSAGASPTADSSFSDSVVTFKIGMSDTVRVVSGVSQAVRYGSLAPVDSVEVDWATLSAAPAFTDTSQINAYCRPLPINRLLRLNGFKSYIMPSLSYTYDSAVGGGQGFGHRYMYIKCTPLRRLKDTSQPCSGACNPTGRVNGLRGFRGEAIVIYQGTVQ